MMAEEALKIVYDEKVPEGEIWFMDPKTGKRILRVINVGEPDG